jgi:hypothetical protein
VSLGRQDQNWIRIENTRLVSAAELLACLLASEEKSPHLLGSQKSSVVIRV